MNWVTTNIRFPEEDYLELKMEAVRQRKSFAALVRDRTIRKKASKKKSINKLIAQMNALAAENARQNPGISFSKELIKMRYE